MREIKDYLKYYIGCEAIVDTSMPDCLLITGEKIEVDSLCIDYCIHSNMASVKPILRRLSSMTEEECNECGNMDYDFSGHPDKRMREHHWEQFDLLLSANQFHYLLSKGFDLFGLIDEGLAIESTPSTINK